MNRQGIPDYVVTFRKPGINTKPISHTKDEFPVLKWQHYASPVWFDIKQSNTLNFRQAREEEDERHICPLQLDLIQRCLDLWSAKGDVVFSPFAGIGSEGFVSLQMQRKFVGIELKKSYFMSAVKNLKAAPTIPIGEVTIPEKPRESAVTFYQKYTDEKPDESQMELL
jgi:DNA modification methylase